MKCIELQEAIEKAKSLTQDEKNEYLSQSVENMEETTHEELFIGLIMLGEKQHAIPELDVDDWEVDIANTIFRY